jgi:hypothetical protein
LRSRAIDEAATQALRDERDDGRELVEFVFGDERLAYEAIFPLAVQDLVASLLAERPSAVRQYARSRIYEAMERDSGLTHLSPSRLEATIRDMLDHVLGTNHVEASV